MITYNDHGVRVRRDGKGSGFGEFHRLLPKHLGLSDIDNLIGIMDNRLLDITEKEDNTWIEYIKNYSDCKFTAIFELKKANSNELNEALLCEPGRSVWAQYMLAMRLHCRMFIVSYVHKKKPPFRFYEILGVHNVRDKGVLDFAEGEEKKKVSEFWQSLSLLTEEQVRLHLVEKANCAAEVEVILLERNQFKSRKFQMYPTMESATKDYNQFVDVYTKKGISALVTLRKQEAFKWVMVKNHRL